MSFTELPDDGSAYLDNPNVRRALDVISMAEGTYDANDPYGVTFGGGSFTDKSAHPNIQKEFTQTDGKVNSSGAAGKYQFTKKTWDDVSGALGLSDFGDKNQDLAAIELMRRRGALDDIASGNLKAGFAKLGGEWASLPSSTYKQNKRSDKWLDDAINGRVGSFTPLPDADGFTELDPDPTIASGQGTDEFEKTDPSRIDLKKGREAEEKLLNDTLAGRASFGMVGGKPYSRKELLGRLNITDEEARMLAGIDDRSALKKTRDALIGDVTSVIKGTSSLASGLADTLSAPYEKLRAMETGAAALVDRALPGNPNQNLQELAQYDAKHAEEVAQQNADSNPLARAALAVRDSQRGVYEDMSNFERDAIPYIVHGKEKISKATGFTGTLKAIADDPVSASMSLVESGPAMLVGLGEAKLTARGIGAASKMLGASDEAAALAAQRAAGLVGTLSEAQASGSQAREMTRFTIMSTPTKVLAQNSPRYQQLVERGVDQYEARQMVADEVASSASLPTSMATALGSALTNKIFGDVTAKIVAGQSIGPKEALRNIIKETSEETVQGLGEDYAQYKSMLPADKTSTFDPGGSTAQNAVGGLSMSGAGTGATLARQKVKSLGAGKYPDAARVLADALNNGEFSPVTDKEAAAYYGQQTTYSTGTPQDAAQQSKAAGETVERAARDTVKAGQDDKVADIGTAQTVDEAIKKARDAIDVDSDAALDRVYAAMGTTRDEVEGAKAAPDTLAQAEAAAMEQRQAQNENQSSQNESDSAPEKVWYGRRGDGYLTQDDAGRALKERQRLNGDLNWGIEQTTDGRFYLAGRKGAVAGENRPTAAQNAPVATQVPTGVENAPQTHMLRTAYQTQEGAQQVADSFGVDGARVIKSPDGYRIVPTPGMTESQKVGEAAVASIERAMGKPAGSIQFAGNIQSIRAAMDGQSPETANRIATSAAAVGQIGNIIGDNFGIGRPILVRGLGFNGAQYNGRYYVDLDYVARQAKYHPATLAVAVTGHEATHMMEKSADPADRAAWRKLKNVVLQYAQPGAIEHRQKTAKGATQIGKAIAELVADVGGAMWFDHKFWARLYELDNGSTMRRVGYKFMEAATKFMSLAKGSNFDINAMVSNVEAVREVYAQVWAEKANRSGKGSNGIESAVAQDGRLPELGGRVQPVSGQVGSEQKAGANARSNPDVGSGREEVSHSTGEQDGLEGNGERLKPLDGYPVNRGVGSAWGPNPHINEVARKYAESIGIDVPRQTKYAEVDPERAARIASAYDEMKHAPDDPVVKEAYENLIRQTTDQYKALTDAGYRFWFMDMSNDENVKYAASPWTAMRDLRDNRQMGVFPTNDGFGTGESFDPSENPLLKDTGIEWPVGGPNSKRMAPVTANDLFRAVHDAFGHGMEGVGFRADGEENAWQAHARLFTGSALGAITSETRGQNSWLNYGPHGESNRTAKVEDTVFADQKTGLMPEWTWHEGLDGVSMSTPESDFKTKEFKDGSILVKGDPESIRDVMPAGVSGRIVDGGIMFKAAMSHRVKSALAGDYMQFSRAGEVRKEMPKNSKGEYIGAPKKYNTPGKITKLRNNLRALAKEGETGRFWYETSGKAVLKFVGGSVEEARKFIALLSIYSPQAAVPANATFALRAWAQYKAGHPINVRDAAKDAKAEAALKNPDKFWSGEKTGNFFLNLMREVDPSTKSQQGATIDMWMMRAAEYPGDRPTNAQYSFMENEINRVASELGWEPQQVQAAIWVAMKARMENQSVNRAVDAKSMKAGNFEFVTDRKGKKVRKFSNEPAHRLMWLDAAFKHNPSETDYRKSGFDFGDGLNRHIGQISWEPIPSIVSGVLPGIHKASYAKQLQFSDDVKKAITDEDGNDMIAQKIGLMSDGIMDAPGVWKDNVSPGSQTTVSMAPDKGKQDGVGGVSTSIDPAQRKLNELYAAIIGLVTVQDAVGYHKPFFGGTLKNSNTTEVDIGKKFTPKQAEELSKAIDAEMVARGYKGWEEKIGLVSTNSGMRVINNRGLFKDNNLFNSIIEAAVDGSKSFKDSKLSRLYADAKLIGNNWSENRNGQEYTRIIEASGQPGLLDWVRTVLAPRVNEVFKKYSGGEGWGDAGVISYSTNEDAGEQGGIGLAEGRGDVPSYGTATEGSTSAVGYHFSTQRRGRLDASYYGTGLRGAEASRLSDQSASDIRPRVYFYVDRGNGVRPESGVGNHAHSVNLQNLYDVSKDSRGIWAKAIREATDDPANAAERAVMEAGYDGYIRTDPRDPQHYAVLIGKRHSAVPVAAASPARSDGKVSTMPRTESDSRTTFDGTSLVRKPTNQQMLDLVKSMRDLKSAAPSMKIEWGQAKVDPSEAATVNAIMEGAGSSFRFDENVSMSTPDAQIDTPEFKRWFGDSKVVDANGKPLVVYHGTGKDFGGVFNTQGGTGKTFNTGAFFTASTDVADSYTNGIASNVVPVYLNLTKPLVVEVDGANWNRIPQKAKVLLPALGKGKDKRSNVRNLFKGEWDYPDDTAATDDIARWARKQGYDGVIFRGVVDRGPSGAFDAEAARKPADMFVAFRPEQIKSATGNNGQFDQSNPDISMSTPDAQINTPEFKRWFGDGSLVDAVGKPLVLYHGTNASFDSFRRSKTGTMGGGVYLGDHPDVANSYDGDGTGGQTIMPVYARGKYMDNYQWTDYIQRHGWGGAEAAARSDGWSGVHDTMFEDAVVVWNPSDIKSAIGNNGKFDQNNPNISMSTPDDRNENGFFGDYDLSGMSAEDIDFDEFMAEANAELDAEFKKESDGGMKAFFARPPSSSSIKDSSIHPESALNLDEFFSGKGKSLRFDQPEYIPGTIEIRDDVVNATYRSSNVFITTKNPETKKMVAAAQAAGNYLNSIRHDILDGVDKKSANRLADEWLAISKRDGAIKSKTSKSRNLEEVLRNMGLPVNGVNENDFRILIELDDGSASVEMEGKSVFTVCTLDMAPSKHGSALYAALGVWAKNNGFKFRADESLSAINTYRRAEQALSFSIKTGDTGVVMPGMPSRVYGYNSAPENEQHHKDNIARLALASLRNAQELFPGISDIRYDPVTDKFTHMDGRDASGAVSRALKNETARELGLGRTTIARAAMTQEILNGGTFKSSKAPFESAVVYSTPEGDALGEPWGDPGKGIDGLNPNLRTFIAGSQIVKEDGTPVMMYHGTSQAFEAFKAKQAGAIFLSYSPKFADDFSAASQSWMLDHWEEVVGDKRADVLKRAADSIMADASTPMKARKRMAGLALAGDVSDGMVKDAIMTAAEEFMPSGPNIMPVFVRATSPFDYMNTSDVDDVVSEVLSGNESIKLDVSGFQAEYTESSLRKDLRNGEWSLIENSKVQDAIKQLGFDSFFVKEGGQRNLAVYDPGSVKSVFNSGSWNREDERLSFSTPQGGFQIPNETKTQYIRRQAQDYFIRALVVQNEVASQGGTVDESNDFYRAEERSLGIRAALVKDFSRRVVQPMMEKTVKYGISLDELSLYAYAKHAKERNDQIATIDKKMPDGGSGMTNKEAKDILDAVAKSGKQKEFDDLHGDLMGIAAANRRVMLDEDLITQDHYDAMERMYSNYIPLRGFELVDPDGKRTGLSAGRGYNIRGKETIRALGRKTRAGQLIENLLGDYERIVDRAERNQVGKFFLKFVLDNPDPKLWEIDATTTRKSFDRYTGRVSRNTVIEKGEDTISVKLNGKEIFIKVKDPLLVRALRMDYKQEMGSTEKFVIRTAGLYASLMRNTLTRYNPEFAITNASRDFGFGMAAMLDELGEGGAARFVKLYPAAIAASNRNERNTQDTSNNKMDKMFEEYKMSGGITAGFYVKDADEISKDIRSMMIEAGAPKLTLTDKITHNQVASVLRKAGNVLEWAGSVSENAARFAGYVAAREMGRSPAEAVRIAKNLTTNFDRKGEKGQIINALYVFYNAAVQGSHRFIKMASNPKVASYMAGFSAASFALAIAAASMGGDDPDDGIAYWDKIPDYVKERNFIIMLPPGSQMDGTESVGSKGRYIAIPLQYGLNLPVAFGYLMADVLRNHQDKSRGLSPTQGAVKMAAYTAGAFNPFGGSVDPSNGSQVAQAVFPSLGDVVIQLATGTNIFGRPVAPFKSDFDPKPDSENYNLRQADGVALKVARWMNWASGGNEARPGVIDVSAGTVENVVRNMTGGTGQFVYDTMNLGWKAVDSATGGAPDISPREIPLARRVYGELGSDVDEGVFYENRKKVQDAAKFVKGEAALGIESPASDIAMAGLNSGAGRITQQLSKIRKEMIRVTQDKDMKDGDKKMQLNELKAARDQLTQAFNAAFMDTMRSFYEENK